jgi:hypothetical protein
MKTIATIVLLVAATLSSSFALSQAKEPDDSGDLAGEEHQVLTLQQVPPEVMRTARAAGPDVFFDRAESYWDKDFRVYRISGRLFREAWNVYVRSDGKLLRTESDNQDS